MKIAIIFTGALRTVKKTIKYFKKHLLLSSDVDIFACVQNDTSQSDNEWTSWFKEQMGSHLKEITWFSIDKYPHWITHRDLLLEHIHLDNSWKGYLRNSGSMIEYFQLQLAYMKMSKYENQNHFSYDYIVRSRTDSIYAKPIDFHWLQWTDEDVAKRVEAIRQEMALSNIEITPQNLLKYFMCTIISDDLIPNLEFILADYTPSQTEIIPKDTELNQYFTSTKTVDECFSKPHPHMVEAILEETKIPADRAVIVGDTHYDLEMGRNARIQTIAVTYGAQPKDVLLSYEPLACFDSFKEVVDFLLP